MSMAEVKFQKPSVVLWLLILGKNLATQINPLVLNCPASCQSLSSPIKRLTELKTPHFPCTVTTQNACSQPPLPAGIRELRRAQPSSALRSSGLPCRTAFLPGRPKEALSTVLPSCPWLLHTTLKREPKPYPRYGH